MKRTILTLVLSTLAVLSQAQAPTTSEESGALRQKIDSLEKELNFNQLNNEMNILNLRVNTFSNEISNDTNELTMYLILKLYNRELDENYELMCSGYEKLKKTLALNAEVMKAKAIKSQLNFSFREDEKEVLRTASSAIDKGMNLLESRIESLKSASRKYHDLR